MADTEATCCVDCNWYIEIGDTSWVGEWPGDVLCHDCADLEGLSR